jgi:hypothetical protein
MVPLLAREKVHWHNSFVGLTANNALLLHSSGVFQWPLERNGFIRGLPFLEGFS